MEIARWTGPPVETHTYLVADPASGEAWAVDAPLETAALVRDHAARQGLRLTRLILTHGHFDHVLDAPAYRAAGVPIAMHPDDRGLLRAPQTALFGLPHPMPDLDPDEDLAEGQRLHLGAIPFDVWHVPGHSPGHVMLHQPEAGIVLGGDLLFSGGYGRVDLPGCDPAAMLASLRRLAALPRETRVYPGHGPETSLGAERHWLKDVFARGAL